LEYRATTFITQASIVRGQLFANLDASWYDKGIQCVKKKIGLCFFYNNFIETASILTWNGLFES
jgi:hypothetical protein